MSEWRSAPVTSGQHGAMISFMGDQQHKHTKRWGRLPDMDICRAKANGLRGYADCWVEHYHGCEYAVPFGSGTLCRHPQRDVIIQNTINAQQGDETASDVGSE
ncbi:MAG: hypothetical protein HN975_01770 [Anaerolineae bacterium]|nr:hypothetical protein [Anaerolineae bacterium]